MSWFSRLSTLRPHLAGLSGRFSGLSGRYSRMLMMMLALAVALSVLVTVWVWRDDANYKPLFGQQEHVQASEMMAALDAEKIPYRLHPQTGQVLVPASALGQARMRLAAKGVVAALPAGLELVDKGDQFGVSQFVQDVRFRRGLEGELVQSILTLDAVQSARVHLSLPRSSSFVSSSQDRASASVVVGLKPGQQLSNAQISAIISMVANSVAGLRPAQVSLVDQAGNLLSGRVDPDDLVAGGRGEPDAVFREQALNNVRDLLLPIVGDGQFRVTVSVDVGRDKIEETHETYDDAPKLLNEANRDESSADMAMLGIPGSLSNRPQPDRRNASDAVSGNQRRAYTRQYAYNRSVIQVKRARGELKRLSVAVVLNQKVAPGGKGWPAGELTRIDQMLRNGLGLNTARGDSLSVTALPFSSARPAGFDWQDWRGWDVLLSWSGWGLLCLLAYLLLIRPLLRLLRASTLLPGVHGADSRAPGSASPAETAGASSATATRPAWLMQDRLPPAGSSTDELVNHLKQLADTEPDRVAAVVTQWIKH